MKSQNKKGGIFAGVIGGIVMVLIGTVLLWWNEGNNVRNIKTTNEVEKNVVEITSDSDNAQYEGKLVALGGRFITHDEKLTDDLFTVSIHTSALSRVVEIYQWEEDSDTDSDGDTTYSYDKVWHEGLIDSSDFHLSGHDNPTSVPYESEAFLAEKVTLGNFRLSDSQIGQMTANKRLALAEQEATIPEGWQLADNYLSNAADIAKPEIGDVRISWQYNNWKEVSLIAQVSGKSFVSYISAQKKSVNYVTEGNKSAAEMIQEMRTQDKIFKWVMRLIGVMLIFGGYASLISPLTKLASFVPLVGNVINGALMLVIGLIGLAHSLLVIAVAWIVYRPLLGIVLLAACAGLGVLAHMLMQKRRAAAVTA